eukprot:c29224_g1_i2 orf=624-3833(-)
MKVVPNDKMTSFSVVRKKTPFQKHREDEEAKKKRADEEAARLYDEFVESFQVDDVPGGKAFVRGGTINPNERSKLSNEGTGSKEGSSGSKKPGSRYVPSFIPPGLAAIVNKGKEPEQKEEVEKPKERDQGKLRNIDHFVEELKIEQEMREKRSQERERSREGRQKDNSMPPSRFDELPEDLDSNGKLPGSLDDVDPQTTNLYVGNLSPEVDENFLLRTFGRFGPIASVKIMWPRTEEERRRQRNCGFVAFMNRTEAQAAKDEMQGIVVYEYELRIGWGKAVALPSQALPAPPPGQMAVRSKEGGSVAWSGPGGPSTPSVTNQAAEVVVTPNVPDIEVALPEDEHLRHVIDTMAMYVLDDGCAFEQAIMGKGRNNPLFSFLFDLGCKEHTYYVWRLYSFAQGDTLQRWRTEPFIMITGSGRWIPPPLPLHTATKSPEYEKASNTTFAAGRGRKVEERALTDSQRDEFEDMLRALTLERNLIKEAMAFSLDNADAAGEVVEVLTESLTLKETPIPTKVARLMLVSDLLHNSSAPVKNASAYRTKFEATLPDMMESFNELYRNITGRITAEALKERVLKVLQVWSDWFLFSDAFVNGLRATFLRPGNSGVPPFHLLCGDAPSVKDIDNAENLGLESIEGGIETMQDAALAIGEGAAARELSSLPFAELERRCRHNGLSIRGGREVMVSRLLSLEEAEKEKNREQDGEMQVEHSLTAIGKSTVSREGKWSFDKKWKEVDGSWKETNHDKTFEPGKSKDVMNLRQGVFDIAGDLGTSWPPYEDDDMENRNELPCASSIGLAEKGTGPSTPNLKIQQTESKTTGTKLAKADPVLPASKWNREDDSSDEDRHEAKGLGLSYSSSGSDDIFCSSGTQEKQELCIESGVGTVNDSGMDEERRQKLRRLEVAVMEYRESIEEHGIKNTEEIERKVAAHRKKLLIEYGLAEGAGDRDGKVDAGSGKYSFRSSERTPSERRERRNEKVHSSSSRKRTRSRSHSKSPSHARDRSSRDREREREREKDMIKERDWEHEVDRERDRDKEKHRDRDAIDSDRDRERVREGDREKERDRDKRSRRS